MMGGRGKVLMILIKDYINVMFFFPIHVRCLDNLGPNDFHALYFLNQKTTYILPLSVKVSAT